MNKVLRTKMKYRVNECSLVTRSVLVSLMGVYEYNYPKAIKDEIVELIRLLDRDIEKRHILPDEDIVDIKLYEEYTYEKENKRKK